jgi:succinate-semialdehyde dehydrogenase/glutarate-semialdehyde dehydrogenase
VTPPLDETLTAVPRGLLIGTDWVRTDATFEVTDPASGQVLAQAADAGVAEALDAVGAAHEAFGGWAAQAPRVRAEVLRRAYEIMSAELEQCARLIVLENG